MDFVSFRPPPASICKFYVEKKMKRMKLAEYQLQFVLIFYTTTMILKAMLNRDIEYMSALMQIQNESSAADFNDCIYEEDSEQICNDLYEYQ